jgi:hypothetical protein
VTGRIPNREKDRYVATLCFGKGFIAPLPPMNWICCVLQQIGARGTPEAIGHSSSLRDAGMAANRTLASERM